MTTDFSGAEQRYFSRERIMLVIGLLEESLRERIAPHPGCLIGSFTYQFQEFDNPTQEAVVKGFDEWRRVLGAKLDAAREQHRSTFEINSSELIDNLLSIFEGGLILSKLYGKPTILAKQLRHHRDYVESLFFGT